MGLKSTIAGWLGLGGLDEFVTYINRVMNGSTDYCTYATDEAKLKVIFSNPAVLKVFSLQCDLFSLGKVYVYKDNKAIPDDPILKMFKKPNLFQRQSQFQWDFMFFNMLGNSYCYTDSKIVSENNKLYILENNKITFNPEFDKYKDMIVLSNTSETAINKLTIQYTQSNGNSTSIPWGKIIHVPDLSNGTGNWFSGRSRIDALYKVVANSEAALDAKNINVRYSGKYMVAGTADPDNVNQLPLGEEEKQDIETKMNGRKSVHAVKSMIDIKRFVDNIANLKLDESYWADYFIIGSMYNIPTDVLEWYLKGSTFENQEKARGAHVSYSLQPKGNTFYEGFAEYFGYLEQGKEIVIDWEHLPFMQVFAKERAETDQIKSQTILNLMNAGVGMAKINAMLDLELTELDYEKLQATNQQGKNNTNT